MTANRRHALRLAAGFAIAPVFASQIARAAAVPRTGFVAPEGSLILQRVLTRGMMDGSAIAVSRSWLVEFEKVGRGYLLSGQQVAASVDAPASLAQFAKLEESRVEESQFPISIDPYGSILRDNSPVSLGNPQEEVARAIDMAIASIAPYDSGGTGRSHIASLAQSAQTLISKAPRDLFYPQDINWITRKSIALPDGGSGEVAVRFDAQMAQSGTVVERASREVVTRIERSERVSREDWHLGAA